MGLPYAFIKVLRREEPYLDKENRLPKEQAEFLMKDNNMKGKYLGACLDSCRWGSPSTFLYEMSMKQMINFIQNWMQQNEGNFENLWHERKIKELYKRFELPFIDYESCPRGKDHKGVIEDLDGKLRCAHKSEKEFRPHSVDFFSYFDDISGMQRDDYCTSLTEESDKFEQEQRTFLVMDACYAILSDKGRILPLETILNRLNLRPKTRTVYCNEIGPCERINELSEEYKEIYDLIGRCQGHIQPNDNIKFPFDGWDLAFYAQKWYQQLFDEKSPVFEK